MKYLSKIITFFVCGMVLISNGMYAGFGVFFPSQPFYYPAPVTYFPAPAPASVGFSLGIPLGDPCEGAPTLGLSVDVPLVDPIVQPCIRTRPILATRVARPVYIDSICRDNEDRRYWRIYNNTDVAIQVMSKTESKTIEPGQSRKLDHSTSFTLKISDGEQKIRIRTTRHALSIEFDENDALKVYMA